MSTRFKWIIAVEVLGIVLMVVGRAWFGVGAGVLVVLATLYGSRSEKGSRSGPSGTDAKHKTEPS